MNSTQFCKFQWTATKNSEQILKISKLLLIVIRNMYVLASERSSMVIQI